jgi:O-antigen ligase
MLNNIFNNTTIPIVLIALLPIGLLVSSGVSELLSILIVIFYIIHLIFKKDYSLINNSYFKLLLILWIYLILNSLLLKSYEINEYSFRSIGFIKYILLIFAFAHYFKKSENIKLVLLFWSSIIFIVCFDIFFEHFSGKNILGFESMHPSRIISFLRKEHKIGHFMLGFSFLIISYLFLKSKNKSIIFLFFCYLVFIILIVSIYLTGERSNAIRASFCLIAFFIFSEKKILKYKSFFLIATLLTILVVSISSEKIMTRFNGQILNPIKENGITRAFKDSEYGVLYYTGFSIFKSHLLLGVGNKNFRNECKKEEYKNSGFKYSERKCNTHPHQIYLELLSEHGFVGTIIILFIILSIVYKNIKIYKKKNNLIHLASILFTLQTFLPLIPSGSFFTSWSATIFWINFAIMIAVSQKDYR